MQQQLLNQGGNLGANAGTLQDPGSAAADTFLYNATGGLLGTKDPNAPPGAPGIGSLLSDLFVLAVVGAGIWAFVKFGGAKYVKAFTKKGKWYLWGTVAAVVLVVYFVYSETKKTASDASSTYSGVIDGIKALNPFNS